ncbi:MAG TPA: thymidylate synthase [Baekduia sp.]
MTVDQHDTFAAAYTAGLRALLAEGREVPGVNDGSSVGSQFGHATRATVELAPYTFTVCDPAACLLRSDLRQPSTAYIAGQWLWVMAGSDDLDRISFYNSRGRAFSEDGRRLSGAFGARMRRSAGDQLSRALDQLRADPASRRATIVFADPADSRQPTRDFPCALALQLLVRDGRLEVVTTMRSQSALMVLPYDAALFMGLHVWAAAALGIPAGPHHWVANSFHVYEDELELARRMADAPPAPARMPSRVANPEPTLQALEAYERQLRTVALSGSGRVGDVPLPSALIDATEFHGALAAVLQDHAAARAAAGAARSAGDARGASDA